MNDANPRKILAEVPPKRRRISGQSAGRRRFIFDPGPFPLADGRVRHVCPITGRSKILERTEVPPPPVGPFDGEVDPLEGLV